jgi:hypothetical protein
MRDNWLMAIETAATMVGLLGGASADEVGAVAAAGQSREDCEVGAG